jgi:hypothetical protein
MNRRHKSIFTMCAANPSEKNRVTVPVVAERMQMLVRKGLCGLTYHFKFLQLHTS